MKAFVQSFSHFNCTHDQLFLLMIRLGNHGRTSPLWKVR